jgi:hypothetical protein
VSDLNDSHSDTEKRKRRRERRRGGGEERTGEGGRRKGEGRSRLRQPTKIRTNSLPKQAFQLYEPARSVY